MEKFISKNIEVVEKEYRLFRNYTAEQEIMLRHIEKMFKFFDYQTNMFLEDLKMKVTEIQNDFDSTGINGKLRESFYFYTNNYANTIGEIYKNFEIKKKRFDKMKRYNISDLIIRNADLVKDALVRDCENSKENNGSSHPVSQIIETYAKEDYNNCKRYLDARICGHSFYITNFFIKDLFSINFSIHNKFMDFMTKNHGNALTSTLSEIEKLKSTQYDISQKINLDYITSGIIQQADLKYDIIDQNIPKLSVDVAKKIYDELKSMNEKLKNKISDTAFQPLAEESNYYQKTAKSKISSVTSRICFQKSIFENLYIIDTICRDFGISDTNVGSNCIFFKDKQKLDKLLHQSVNVEGDYEICRPKFSKIQKGKSVKYYKDPKTNKYINVDEHVTICRKDNDKYLIKNYKDQPLSVPTNCISVIDKEFDVYESFYATVLSENTKLSNEERAKSSKIIEKFTNLFKRSAKSEPYKSSSTNIHQQNLEYEYVTKTLDFGNMKSKSPNSYRKSFVRDINDFEPKKFGEINTLPYIVPTNEINIYNDFTENNYENTLQIGSESTEPGVMSTNNDSQITHGRSKKRRKTSSKWGLEENNQYQILRKSHNPNFEEVNSQLLIDEPVVFLFFKDDCASCIVKSLRLQKEFLVPTYYISDKYYTSMKTTDVLDTCPVESNEDETYE